MSETSDAFTSKFTNLQVRRYCAETAISILSTIPIELSRQLRLSTALKLSITRTSRLCGFSVCFMVCI